MTSRSWVWSVGKALGAAGLVGVAATGVVIVRDQRRRSAYGPDEVRARLLERYAEVAPAPTPRGLEPAPPGE